MKKGDLAFFYHSNCKVPGIVGIMEIVQEHSPDGAFETLLRTASTHTDLSSRIRIRPLEPLLRREIHQRGPQMGRRPRRVPTEIPHHDYSQRPQSPVRTRQTPREHANPQTDPAQRIVRDARTMEIHHEISQGEGRRWVTAEYIGR